MHLKTPISLRLNTTIELLVPMIRSTYPNRSTAIQRTLNKLSGRKDPTWKSLFNSCPKTDDSYEFINLQIHQLVPMNLLNQSGKRFGYDPFRTVQGHAFQDISLIESTLRTRRLYLGNLRFLIESLNPYREFVVCLTTGEVSDSIICDVRAISSHV